MLAPSPLLGQSTIEGKPMGLFGKKKDAVPQAASTDPTQQLLAFGALLVEMYKRTPETLVMGAENGFSADVLLRDAWQVGDTDSANSTIEWLLTTGDRAEQDFAFQRYQAGDPGEFSGAAKKMLDKIMKAMSGVTIRGGKLQPAQLQAADSVLAWDLERAAFVARLAFNASYLTEDEAYAVLGRVRELAQAAFGDWIAYLISFMAGRSIALPNTDFDAMNFVFLDGRNLEYMKKSIWFLNPLR
jgi:hypothetical protein